MHARVAKINVHQIRGTLREDFAHRVQLAAIEERRRAPHELQKKGAREAALGGHHLDRVERKLLRAEALLRHHERRVTPQSRDLTVNVQHLRLQKLRAVTGNEWPRHRREDSGHAPFANRQNLRDVEVGGQETAALRAITPPLSRARCFATRLSVSPAPRRLRRKPESLCGV